MKILLGGSWAFPWHAEVLMRRLQEAGCVVVPFREDERFSRATWARIQHKYRWGPLVGRLNRDLLSLAAAEEPDVVFLVRGDLIYPSTLAGLKAGGASLVGYNNDDPFSERYPRYVWRLLRDGLPRYDLYFAYRHSNIAQYLGRGCPRSELLRSWYDRDVHRPLPRVDGGEFLCDVSFTGHFEPDGRDLKLAYILRSGGIRLRIFGGGLWRNSRLYLELKKACGEIRPALGDDYNRILNSSKIALVFLSHLNNDTYTRRSFEIPAAGTFMLSEYTEDMASLFTEGAEAEYFRSPEEMVDKIRFYLANDAARVKIARAGRERLLKDGHEAADRVAQILRAMTALGRGLPPQPES